MDGVGLEVGLGSEVNVNDGCSTGIVLVELGIIVKAGISVNVEPPIDLSISVGTGGGVSVIAERDVSAEFVSDTRILTASLHQCNRFGEDRRVYTCEN